MQMPVMAKGVFIGCFIALRPACVKGLGTQLGVAETQHVPTDRILLNMSAKTLAELTELPALRHLFDPFAHHFGGMFNASPHRAT
jgi:hypothetical protein